MWRLTGLHPIDEAVGLKSNTTRSLRILTRSHIAGDRFFTGEGSEVNVTLASQEQCSRLQQSWFTAFCCVHRSSDVYTAVTYKSRCFSMGLTPQKFALPLGDLDPLRSSTWFLGPTQTIQTSRGSVVERRSLAGALSLSCARPGWPLMWVNRPLWVNQPGQLSLSSLRGR